MKKILCILMLLFSNSALANQEELESLAKETHKLFDHDIPFSMPQIEYLDLRFMQERVCKTGCPKGFEVKGFYHEGVVYLSDRVTFQDDWDRGYFVHEMVHYYQEVAEYFKAGEKKTCEERQKLELQAYAIQDQFLRTKGKFIKEKDMKQLTEASAWNCSKQQSIPLDDQQHNSQQTP